ncbi:bifunctional 3-(3-hydroxy-phenyl)propionate/3-hydroxycinnamic acid hydroxylase [Streptomyces sp. RKCA744]|uniref:bifunctional 3-(3-hydroxy-phenyl)propionate/3-hydroxycinnamic acid hydroxylase MhpA n=1 Tax=Streptomyces sp. RKCA744 TaxID=2959340 RepID=UPI0020A08637|nr:bifunctional 3-(3-hydroxy-phenyl)propionate/3-hydroxycinnamic acid hydroxylase [Streptomyces sp. RKCA744]MCO8302425.1 bifunctional 3-(3-hydroxy-phenyl)propionate/3-hydroxycinnamic acid hydroxylase [Streptomyces sp. RKCA744]
MSGKGAAVDVARGTDDETDNAAHNPAGKPAGSAAGDAAGEERADVLIVGYGPVGQLLSVLLAQRGRRVTVVERWPTPYQFPRAVGFDSEAARILASAGIGESLEKFTEPARDHAWQNTKGETLIDHVVRDRGHCTWPEALSAYQPALEAALIEHGETLPELRVLRGYEAVGLADDGDHVTLTVVGPDGEKTDLTAPWVVGCDGANSLVRSGVATTMTDLDFSYDWLICDVRLREHREFRPNNLEICDPARPRTAVSAGPGHRRYEFMRVPADDPERFGTVENAWELLGLFDVTPDNGVLDRHAVYTFQARWAEHWRAGRMLLAGDSAHLMPPFAGQGMCSGFRDAANLAWKLDLVLGGQAAPALLDTYTTERRAHVRHAVEMSVGLGRVVCMADPAAAADRDAAMLAARKRNIGPSAARRSVVRPLVDGLLRRDGRGGPAPSAGQAAPQWRVSREGHTGLFDDVVGTGFVLLSGEDVARALDARQLAFLESVGTRLVRVVPADTPTAGLGPRDVVDVEGRYLPYLAELGALAVLVRPDFYVFGIAPDREGLPALVDDLAGQLRPVTAPS